MSEVSELSSPDKNFLVPYLPPAQRSEPDPDAPHRERVALQEELRAFPVLAATPGKDSTLPFVTLTYASSLDGMISLAPGSRTTLSGLETKSMTHYLRLHHDAILVGVGTAISDDPALNCRYPGVTLSSQPRPVIVDPKGRWRLQDSKVVQLAADRQGKTPWIIQLAPESAVDSEAIADEKLIYLHARTKLSTSPTESAKIEWPLILRTLKQKGIGSVMIEGGASIISTLLGMPELVDSAIITLAPTWLGNGGVAATPAARCESGGRVNAARLQEASWRQFGADAVLCGRLQT